MKIIDEQRVPSPIDAVYYVPDFITVDEEWYLLRKVRPMNTPAQRNLE